MKLAGSGYTLTATGSGGTATATKQSGTFNITPTAVSQLALSSANSLSPEVAGGPFNVTVSAEDSFGNVNSSYTGTVTFTSSDGLFVAAPASYTYQASDMGAHSYSLTLKTAGTQTFSAVDSMNGLSVNSGKITVKDGMPANITITAGNSPTQLGISNSVLPIAFQVKVTDSFGNALDSIPVTWTVIAGDGSLSSKSSLTLIDGTSSSRLTLNSVGGNTVTASVMGYPSLVATFLATTYAPPYISGGLANANLTYSFPLNSNSYLPLMQGTRYLLASATDPNLLSVSWNCTYQTVGLATSDPNFAALGTACSILPSLVVGDTYGSAVVGKVSTQSSLLYWTPTNTQRGTYKFSIQPTDGTYLGVTTVFNASVMEMDTTANLLYDLDALFSTTTSGLASNNSVGMSTSTWLNLMNGSTSNTLAASTWSGIGTTTLPTPAPYALSLNGSTSNIDLGSSVISGSSRFAMESWVQPASVASSSAGSVMVSNGGGSGNGVALRQSTAPLGKAEFVVGGKFYSYRDLVLSDQPSIYMRLNDSNTTALDSSGYQNNGVYNGLIYQGRPSCYVEGMPGVLTDGDKSIQLIQGYSGCMGPSVNNVPYSASLSVEMWFKTSDATNGRGYAGGLLMGWKSSSVGWGNPLDRMLWMGNSGKLYFGTWNGGRADSVSQTNYFNGDQTIPPYYNISPFYTNYNLWNGGHPAYVSSTATYDDGAWHHVVGTLTTNSLILYVDGQSVGTPITNLAVTSSGANTGSWLTGNGAWYMAGNYHGGSGNTVPFWTDVPSSNLSAYLDEAAVYNSVLTPTQVLNHYNTGKYGPTAAVYPGNAIQADKPVGYWRLNENAGNTATDFSGNSYNGTYTGTVTLAQPGPVNGARDSDTSVTLDGTTGSVQIPYQAALNSSLFTYEAWVYVTGGSGTTRTVIASNNSGVSGINIVATAANNWEANIGNGTSWTTLDAGSVILNTWTYLALTYNGSTAKFYVNAANTPISATATLSPGTSALGLGASSSGTTQFFPGSIGEVAVYNYPLSVTQITTHYNSGNGPGWWYCQSKTALNPIRWNFLSTSFDSITGGSQLFVNGQQECSVTPQGVNSGWTYTASSNDIFVGSTPTTASQFWNGLIATLKFFGTSDKVTTPLPPLSIATDFAAEANRFRTTPVENIVTTGLVLNLDAANAQQGTTTYPTGCSGVLPWFDFSGNGTHGILTGFSGCTTTDGWQGTGSNTPSAPYALQFNGSTDSVTLNSNITGASTAVSITGWINFTHYKNNNVIFYGKGSQPSSATNGYYFMTSAGTGNLTVAGSDAATFVSSSAPSAGSWVHVAMVISGTSATLYLNGKAVYLTTLAQNLATNTSNLASIGSMNNSTYAAESIATLQVYNTAFTLQQVKQNCLAQELRFTATSTQICGAQ